MGQEIVRSVTSSHLVERRETETVEAAPTDNQKRLRDMLQGDAEFETTRFYHPPETVADEPDWDVATARDVAGSGTLTHTNHFTPQADPKACWTGFAFGIASAGAVGFAFFLSLATVAPPQMSVAALEAIEARSEKPATETAVVSLAQSAIALRQDSVTRPAINQSIWQKLRQFHASAGKFSQPGILLVAAPDDRNPLKALQPEKRKAAFAKARLEPVVFEATEQGVEKVDIMYTNSVEPKLINVVDEPQPDRATPSTADAKQREPIVVEPSTPSFDQKAAIDGESAGEVHASFSAYRDVSELQDDSGPRSVSEVAPPLPPRRPTAVASVKGVKIVRSSLRPTARTKVSLGRSNSATLRKRRLKRARATSLGRLSPKKPSSQSFSWVVKEPPKWAKEAFRSSLQSSN